MEGAYLPLAGEVTETGRNTDQEGVKVGEGGGFEDGIVYNLIQSQEALGV